MMAGQKIDILGFHVGENMPDVFVFRNVISLADSVKAFTSIINDYLSSPDSDWVLFWDFNYGMPDANIVAELAGNTADVYHAGLKFGLACKPDVLNYIQPLWMYNKDASPEVEHSSFRLSSNSFALLSIFLSRGKPGLNNNTPTSMPLSASNLVIFNITFSAPPTFNLSMTCKTFIID